MSEGTTVLAPNAAAGDIQTARILIIDDEAAIRESLETLLVLEGYSVGTAPDGVKGLDELERQPYDLVLLDLALPGENGIDLLPRILDRHPELPVIMITAYGTVTNVVDAIRAGARNFVQKPWENEKLLADIRAAIAQHRTEDLTFASPDWTLEQAAAAMVKGGFRHLVVVEDHDVAGLLSMRDIVRCWTPAEAAQGTSPQPAATSA